ncbi:MAG: DUF89 family protein [Desulfobacterales bacterium]|nr:DUF89 family protein [Desulfobacterales bacterium]
MRTSLDCLSCIVRQAIASSRLVTKDEITILEIMKMVFQKLSIINLLLTPPEIVQEVHAIIRKELNDIDPFLSLKQMSIQRALKLAEAAKISIKTSKNPFASAIAFAIAGNIIDFGMKSEWNEEIISESFSKALDYANCIDHETVNRIYHEIDHAKTVLILGDNAGESVFDRLLIENFPQNSTIFYAVKSSPVINDVTLNEAIDSGLDKVATIISNGADIPGTVLSKCSADFIQVFNTADVVISKGQGNFETLNEEKRKIWFLFQVKCSVIAKHYNYRLGDWMILEK